MSRPIHKYTKGIETRGKYSIQNSVLCFMHRNEQPQHPYEIEVTTESRDVTCPDCIRLDSVWGYIKPLENGDTQLYIEFRQNGRILTSRHNVNPEDAWGQPGFVNYILDLMVYNLDEMARGFLNEA